jgi:syntaxin 18
MTLRDLNARIRAFEDAEQLRQNTEAALLRKRLSRGLGVLGSWAAGDGVRNEQASLEAAARQIGVHRESVIWFLRTRLQEAAQTQQRMMETRLTREMEKNRSVLAKAKGPVMAMGAHETANNSIRKPVLGATANGTSLPMQEEEEIKKPVADNLTDGQRQLFEKGNQDMLKHLESTLDKVR